MARSKLQQESAKRAADPLAMLTVIDKLEVGPASVSKNKVTTPYKVTRGNKVDSFDLEYRFEEEVFKPEDLYSQNLAHTITAQVALNYGLFCKQIIFHGLYDSYDQKFIREMAANTAREIYVMKFLQPNPFLLDEAAHLPAVKLPNYLRSEIRFPDRLPKAYSNKDANNGWTGLQNRHAVLSSGGKDSLLSFGLLHEMGYESHSVFINESGRHWFTALNAYRYLKATHPETTRVWTNSDRLFSWMLRHLPFVRQDFARIRSDEYPIRLWTVAVFLFGALPVMRKRGLGRLIIGDEYDTTVRLSHKGIPHYNGLYDQSRHFDNALTRYFTRKGWGISQFSLLRQLSELLIEKILAQRYPRLQKHQLSCHAAHTEGDRVHPCGKCEKCRRIVGMLLAVGASPRHCGYSEEQTNACLKALGEKGVHQESAGAQHMYYLLKEKKLIPAGQSKTHRVKPHPEILKLRFDPERSPLSGIPADLRKRLFSILLEEADGVVQKQGRVWIDFDLLNDPGFVRPYTYGTSVIARVSHAPEKQIWTHKKRNYVLGDLTWPEAKERFKEVDVALLPVGALEQHGPHLPLDTDSFDADYLACQVAAACSDPKPVVLPLIPYGVSYHHDDFTGTLSVSNEALSRFVYEVGISVARNGITKLIIINGHGGNEATLQFAAQTINRDARIFTCVDSGETSDRDIEHIAETPNDVHAGEIETSTSMAIRPNLVDMQKARESVPHFSSRYLNFSSFRSVEWNARTSRISPSGVLGDPTKASREKGQRIWEVMIKNLVEFVEQLKGMSLEEIFDKKY